MLYLQLLTQLRFSVSFPEPFWRLQPRLLPRVLLQLLIQALRRNKRLFQLLEAHIRFHPKPVHLCLNRLLSQPLLPPLQEQQAGSGLSNRSAEIRWRTRLT
jgi:hypothetical protein